MKPISWDLQPEDEDSIEAMVASYRSIYLDDTDRWIKSLSTFTDFICGSANILEAPDVPDDVKFCKNSHQRRMPHHTVKQAYKALITADLDEIESFTDIYDRVISATESVKNFGQLAQFDFTQRYCYHRAIFPDKVYLHAGVMVGLKALIKLYPGLTIIKHPLRGKMVDLASLPEPIADLGTFHAENFLCVYKSVLNRQADSVISPSAPQRRSMNKKY